MSFTQTHVESVYLTGENTNISQTLLLKIEFKHNSKKGSISQQ